MSDCLNCNEIDLTSLGTPGTPGIQGIPGTAGAPGTNGVAVLYNVADTVGAGIGAWTTVIGYSVPANTLVTAGDKIKITILASGGSSILGQYDAIRVALDGTSVVSTDASYPILASAETYHFPYTSKKPMIIEITLIYKTATTAQVFMEMSSNSGNRIDNISTAFSFAFASNSNIVIQTWQSVSGSVDINNVNIVKYLK